MKIPTLIIHNYIIHIKFSNNQADQSQLINTTEHTTNYIDSNVFTDTHIVPAIT